MKIILLSEERIRLEGGAGPLSIESASAETSYSPFHMLASAVASCTYSVLAAWGTHAHLPFDGLAVEVGWSFAEDPHRVGTLDVVLDWPGLPAERRAAAERAAALCPVSRTLEHPPHLHLGVKDAG
ncbi:MAG: OsmC family protein [Gemmatimonadota bacterium]|nr:OsmC family protein [Gemmatimonadota bacterium]